MSSAISATLINFARSRRSESDGLADTGTASLVVHLYLGTFAREALLKAIARSRGWMETILSDKTASFDDIALSEALAERHVRRLAVLAFLSPKVVRAIADGAAPSGVTVSSLTQALPHAWADQERLLGLG